LLSIEKNFWAFISLLNHKCAVYHIRAQVHCSCTGRHASIVPHIHALLEYDEGAFDIFSDFSRRQFLPEC